MCNFLLLSPLNFESTLFTRRITKGAHINYQRGSPPRQRAPVYLKMLLRYSKHSSRIKVKDQRRGGGEKRPMGYKVSGLKAPSPKEKPLLGNFNNTPAHQLPPSVYQKLLQSFFLEVLGSLHFSNSL
uniref:Uncharacterized protein n=1 Tax=Micrurus lemniscatus lemniscatus TaxID=129467 RepID=A0A2D4HWK1_MICLE